MVSLKIKAAPLIDSRLNMTFTLPRTFGMRFHSFFHSCSHSGRRLANLIPGMRFWNEFLNVWLLLINTDFDDNFNNFGLSHE